MKNQRLLYPVKLTIRDFQVLPDRPRIRTLEPNVIVPQAGLEPALHLRNMNLNHARLPIPPLKYFHNLNS